MTQTCSSNNPCNNPSPVTMTPAEIAKLRRQLLSAIRRACPAWLASQAEDITQEALVKLLNSLSRIGDENHKLPNSYINKTAYHATIDAIRRQRKFFNEVSLDDKPLGEYVHSGDSSSPEHACITERIMNSIDRCLEKLTESRQEAVTLKLQGHSVPEISTLMGWSQTKTTNLVYRGMKDMQHGLLKQGLAPHAWQRQCA